MNKVMLSLVSVCLSMSAWAAGEGATTAVADDVIKAQNAALAAATDGKGFGPQSPRDLTAKVGENARSFGPAPHHEIMNLCNIHFHANAEHKGGEFTKYVGNGDGHGFNTGYAYSRKLTDAEKKPLDTPVCKGEHGGLNAGDTVELHYVFSSAHVAPGPTLSACLSESLSNPQLRVEAQVFVLVNNPKAADFNKLVEVGQRKRVYQALNIPTHTGKPVTYAGSTTGPGYNEKGSPLQVTWSVRPAVMKVSAESVGKWCQGNMFKEDHAHGVRNLVTNPALLSPLK